LEEGDVDSGGGGQGDDVPGLCQIEQQQQKQRPGRGDVARLRQDADDPLMETIAFMRVFAATGEL